MKNRQGLTIAALIVAIVGLSIGFAAFSNTLTISSSASVNPDDSAMNVVWSSSSSSAATQAIVPTLTPNNVTNFTSTNATITGTDYRTLNNVSAAFTAPGQSVTYNLHVFNAGSYTAYLTNLVMGSKTCAAIEQQNASDTATDSLVQSACNGISISVTIGTETLTSSGSLNNQAIAPRASVAAQVVITYAEGSSYVDGPMSVTFGNITFNASTVQGSSQQGGNEPSPATPTYSVGDTYNEDYISTQQGVLNDYIGSSTNIVIPESLPIVEKSDVIYNGDKCSQFANNNNFSNDFCSEVEKYLSNQPYDTEILGSSTVDYINNNTSNVADVIYTVVDATQYDVTTISASFAQLGISTLVLNTKISSIPMGCFYGNNLTNLDITSNVVLIEDVAFYDNNLLTSVRIHNNKSNVNISDNLAFPEGTQLEFDDETIIYGQ